MLCFNQTAGFPLSAPVLSWFFAVQGKSRRTLLVRRTSPCTNPLPTGGVRQLRLSSKGKTRTPAPNPQSQSRSRGNGNDNYDGDDGDDGDGGRNEGEDVEDDDDDAVGALVNDSNSEYYIFA